MSQFNQQHKYLTISSSDRINGTPSRFSVNLPYGIQFNYAELISCSISNTFYNVTAKNNTLIINSTTYNIVPGCYNFDELINVIVNSTPIDSITYNDSSGVVTINITASSTLSFSVANSLGPVLGFTNTYSQTGTVFNSSFPPTLFYASIYIDITEFQSNQFTSNSNYKTPTFCIPNNANKNFVIFYSQFSQHEQRVNMRDQTIHIHNLNISLKDQFGQELQAVQDWSLVLKLNVC